MSKLDQVRKILEIANTDKASTREVAAVLKALIESVNRAITEMRSEVSSGMKSKVDVSDFSKKLDSISARFEEMVAKSSKDISNETYKSLNNEVYKLEKLIREIPEFDSSSLEKKWSITIEDLRKQLGQWKQFELKGEEIVDKVNALPIREEDQIGFEHIKGWKDTIGTFVKGLGLGGSRSIFGGRSGGTGFYKLPLNGVTKSFTIPNFRGGDIAILGSSFPTAFAKTTDYTVNGSVITFTDEIDASTTLSEGQTIIVLYNQLFFTK